MNKFIVLLLSAGIFLFAQENSNNKKKNKTYDVKARLVLSVGINNQTFYGLGDGEDDVTSIGFSQKLSGMVYLSELDKELKKKLIKKAPKKMRKQIKKLESISVGADQFSPLYSLIPDQMNYTTSDDFDLLFLNWAALHLSLGLAGFDLSLSSVYYDDKNNFDKGKLKIRPSAGFFVGLPDISFSKKFPFSFDIYYQWRYLLPSMEFYENSSFSEISSQPSFTLNVKIPFEIPVSSSKL